VTNRRIKRFPEHTSFLELEIQGCGIIFEVLGSEYAEYDEKANIFFTLGLHP
jgi:hypothetical protein